MMGLAFGERGCGVNHQIGERHPRRGAIPITYIFKYRSYRLHCGVL